MCGKEVYCVLNLLCAVLLVFTGGEYVVRMTDSVFFFLFFLSFFCVCESECCNLEVKTEFSDKNLSFQTGQIPSLFGRYLG